MRWSGLSMQMYDNLAPRPVPTRPTADAARSTTSPTRAAWPGGWRSRTSRSISRPNFHEKVIKPFVSGYLAGTTPSPCVLCNTHVKFDLFHEKALAIGAEKIATGHYARITEGRRHASSCARRVDLAKDQSLLSVRAVAGAARRGAVSTRRDDEAGSERRRREGRALRGAQEGVVRDLLRAARRTATRRSSSARRASSRGEAAGEIVDFEGNVVGTHDGYYHFTIGQRRGLDIGGTAERTYVVDVNPFTKRVTVGPASRSRRTR